MIKRKQNGQKVWVTFSVTPSETLHEVALSGEWNDWQIEPMKVKKSGEFYLTKVLPAGCSYQFGYKLNGSEWITDEECPSVASPFLSQNSLLEL